jgi:hypothetical protein
LDQRAVYIDALKCGIEGWMEIWGDPFVSGTLFMVSYTLAAVIIFKVALQATGRERRLWQLCGLLFAFQVLNTHLDLHAFPGTFGRCLAHAQGWYESRRQVQMAFLIILGTFALLVLLLTFVYFHKNVAGNLLLVSGVAVALGITAIKGINHHGGEHYYGGTFGAFRGADLIEFSGIMIAITAALTRVSKAPR